MGKDKKRMFVFSLLILIAAQIYFARPAFSDDIEYAVDMLTANNQYVLQGDYKRVFKVYDEVVILSIDRPMGFGFVEYIAGSYMVVRAMRIDPGFFLKDATRIRKLVLEKADTLKKTIDSNTIIDYQPETVTLDVWSSPDTNDKKVKKQPYTYSDTYTTEPAASEGTGAVKKSRRREKAETTAETKDQAKPAPETKETLSEKKDVAEKDSSQKSSRRRRTAEKKQIEPEEETSTPQKK